jgi:drug/metabolite transporter (DMT)-like permease
VAIFLGWIFLEERLTSRSMLASAIILAGVVMMTLGRKRRPKEIDIQQ